MGRTSSLFKGITKILKTRTALALLFFLIIFFIGFFGFHFAEDIGWFDSLYWTVITLATVGYGDVTPAMTAGKILAIFISLFGIGMYAVIITFMANHFININIRSALGLKRCSWKNHLIICGWNEGIESAIEELSRVSHMKVVVVKPPNVGPSLEEERLMTIADDYMKEAPLKKAGLDRASYVIVSTGDDSKTILSILMIKRLRPDVKIVAEVISGRNGPLIKQAGADRVVNSLSFSGRLLASSIYEPGVPAMFEEISTSAFGNDVVEVRIPKQLIRKNFKDALIDLKERNVGILVGIRREDRTIVNPGSKEILKDGDLLLMICSEGWIERLKSI